MTAPTVCYLFICAANRNRSKAAERLCRELAQFQDRDIQCESAGVDPLAERQVTKPMADKADRIFVMEDYMQTILQRDFRQAPEKIVCLDIPDIYPLQDPMLEAILTKKLALYI